MCRLTQCAYMHSIAATSASLKAVFMRPSFRGAIHCKRPGRNAACHSLKLIGCQLIDSGKCRPWYIKLPPLHITHRVPIRLLGGPTSGSIKMTLSRIQLLTVFPMPGVVWQNARHWCFDHVTLCWKRTRAIKARHTLPTKLTVTKTGDESATESTVDSVADLSPVCRIRRCRTCLTLSTLSKVGDFCRPNVERPFDFVASVYGA